MEAQLFEPGTIPEYATPGWYADRDAAPHLEQEGHRQRLELAADFAFQAIELGGQSVVDVGAGDGGLLSLIAPKLPSGRCWGYDLQPANVEAAETRGVTVLLGDVVDGPIVWGDVVVATEILEHLVDPHGLLRRAHDSGAKYLIASSPYMETAESHYGYHLWAWDEAGYQQMIEDAGWTVRRSGRAWICSVVLAARA